MVREKSQRFCTNYSSHQQFSVRVKIFPFDNKVVSIHILIMRIEKTSLAGDSKGDEGGELDIEEEK